MTFSFLRSASWNCTIAVADVFLYYVLRLIDVFVAFFLVILAQFRDRESGFVRNVSLEVSWLCYFTSIALRLGTVKNGHIEES